jgi:cephalosporin hydroxylase
MRLMGLGFGLRNKFDRVRAEISYQLQNLTTSPRKSLRAAYLQPSDMCEPDKLMLYSLVRGLRPRRVLEIGVRWGGGARIISAALEDNGDEGFAVGIDPETAAFRPNARDLHNRYFLLEGYSPGAIDAAAKRLGGKIDFCLIDAMHTHDHVLADLSGVLSQMETGGHITLHDTFHAGINAAVGEVLARSPHVADCGFLTRHPEIQDGVPVAYQGLRLLRVGPVDDAGLISASFSERGRSADLSPSIHNWDHHWNRIKDQQPAS